MLKIKDFFSESKNPVWDIKKDFKSLPPAPTYEYKAPYHLDTKIEETRDKIQEHLDKYS